MLGLITGASLATLVGCAAGSDDAATGSAGSAGSAGSSGTAGPGATASGANLEEVPEETAGPYPGDGSNGPNILNQSGIVRSDIRSSFGTGSAVAAGVPLTMTLTVLDAGRSGAPYSGAAVYLWHCDLNGGYSMYSRGITNENYLRGVQAADAGGTVTFKSIFPAAYSGRWPHVHFEVYPTLDKATASGNKISTSQLALPAEVCQTVYATDGYAQSVRNLAQTSLGSDMVFRDGYARQLATVTGSVSAGYTATLTVPV
jgi:protocatechuate 3,4-dioxygenase beta subunit